MSVIFILLLITVSVLLSAMVAGYSTLSTAHLRHWAKQKDPAARKLYPLKARGSATLLTLELLRAVAVGGVVVSISQHLSLWLAWLVISLLVFVAFMVLTQLYLKPFGIRLLVWLGVPLMGLTNFLKPLSLPLGGIFDRFLDDEPVTLTRSELSRTLQVVSPEDTDITAAELRMLGKVLTFAKKTVHDVMVLKTKTISIKAGETLTPVVLDELHKSGHGRFPVLDEDGKTVVGILNMYDLMDIKLHDKVAEAMMRKVYFIDEDRDLNHALQVFSKTRQSVLVVQNQNSDMVGLVSLEDIVQQIVGKPPKQAPAEPTIIEPTLTEPVQK